MSVYSFTSSQTAYFLITLANEAAAASLVSLFTHVLL